MENCIQHQSLNLYEMKKTNIRNEENRLPSTWIVKMRFLKAGKRTLGFN
jgi:hypothetical protein